MNHQIRILAEQAGFYYTDKTGFIAPAGCDPAKFAELIVRDIHTYVDGMDTAQVISNGILRQYGMEE